MRIFIVWYVTTSYQEVIEGVFLDRDIAQAFINTIDASDRNNYYISWYDVDDAS